MSQQAAPAPRAGELPEETHVVVVGGGIAGTAAAYHLAREGIQTLLLERNRIGEGATGAAVGVLSPPMRQPFDETVHFRGPEVARRIWEFALRSVKGLGDLLTERGDADEAGLDLSGGHVLADAHSLHQVEQSYQALERASLPVTWLSGDEVRTVCHGRGFLGGYRIEGGGAIEPAPAARALARAARDGGATVLEGVEVHDARRTESGFVVETSAGDVRSEMVVFATHVDTRRFSPFLRDEIVPIRGQAMVTAPGGTPFRGAFATHWKLNVWRTDPKGRLVLGGWRHDAWDRAYWKTRPEVDPILQESLQGWFESTFPERAPLSIERRWSGIFGWTADYLPMVGPLPGRAGEMVIAGFSGGGLPFAFEAGKVIARIASGGARVEGTELFNPRRFT